MLNIRVPGFLLLIVFLCSLFSGNPTDTRSQETEKEIQQISGGNHSVIAEPFIFVARDAETYALLRTTIASLPSQDGKFFQENAVIAVFLGQRPTGGYNIVIAESSDGSIRVSEHRPPKGSMQKMVLSAPYKIVSVPADQNGALTLSLDERWQGALRAYRLTYGEATVTGGFAGKREVVKLEGKIEVIRAGELATLLFDIRGSGERRLTDIASGKVDKSSRFVLKRVDAFGLAGALDSPFKISGEFAEEGRQMMLQLETVPSPYVSDNFSAVGSVQAAAAK
jgi:hypothetical protein